MSTSNQHKIIHDLYHEAKRRAAEPQPVIKHAETRSLLLSAPNNIMFELFNTVIKEMPGERLLEFVTNNFAEYLSFNWDSKITQRAIFRLRREQAADIRAGLDISAPIIRELRRPSSPKLPKSPTKPESPATTTGTTITGRNSERSLIAANNKMVSSPRGSKSGSLIELRTQQSKKMAKSNGQNSPQKSPPLNYNKQSSRQEAIRQVYEHIMWRIKSNNVTQITSLLVKLALDDGYKRGKLKVELYDDVAACFKDWRSSKLIKLYAFGSAPANDQRLLLASTNYGDLSNLVANYIDGSDKRQNPDLIRKLAGALRDKTKNCIFITNDLGDALRSIQTGAIRCAFVVDRLKQYEQPLKSNRNFFVTEFPLAEIETLIIAGKLYIMSSLSSVEFAPDPTADNCC